MLTFARASPSGYISVELYLSRLRRIALRLPADFVVNSIGDMKKRCVLLDEKRGGDIEG